MPTLATGARPAGEAGFTLVELMVTLVIMGLIAGAVALTVPDGRPRLSDEADRFAARLTRAREEAVMTNRNIDVAVTARGYSFRTLSRGAWTTLDAPPLADAAWPEGVTARLEAADGRESIRFGNDGAAGAARVVLSLEDRQIPVVVDEAGDVRIDAPAS